MFYIFHFFGKSKLKSNHSLSTLFVGLHLIFGEGKRKKQRKKEKKKKNKIKQDKPK